jgi:hypothetical protein
MKINGCDKANRRIEMSFSRRLMSMLAVLAVSVPAVALAQGGGPSSLPSPAKAYGVICQRAPYSTSPGTPEFGDCVKALGKGTRDTVGASDAARTACRQATPPLPGDEFGACVSSTKTLVQGLKALHAH